MKKNKSNAVKVVAEKNIRPVLGGWVTEVFGLNPTRKDYEEALSFVEDIIKNVQKEPNFLKLLASLALSIERSKFVDKLLPYIFRTVVPSSGKSKMYQMEGLEFEHKLIIEELKDTAEELRQLKAKAKK
ncbi:MAG: hypothetical protein UV76_C0001G0034 [Candidatus Nomurabacteria bacterium GW2011_GWA2_43_15]|uniref:Uncharacterized protein n=1 Tax=Candidatus Nomurabacteria bacterium GW2011_GWA2_43_15 TaxID=1618738 RepID=A0A0G1DTR0_9BACT|nr:MAG: hypothetical protein UV76_C0001G0034 [Candidatus Nomurabacteria bacterium GW2011_GWA2_43_15]